MHHLCQYFMLCSLFTNVARPKLDEQNPNSKRKLCHRQWNVFLFILSFMTFIFLLREFVREFVIYDRIAQSALCLLPPYAARFVSRWLPSDAVSTS